MVSERFLVKQPTGNEGRSDQVVAINAASSGDHHGRDLLEDLHFAHPVLPHPDLEVGRARSQKIGLYGLAVRHIHPDSPPRLIVLAPNHSKQGRSKNVPWLGFGPVGRQTLVWPKKCNGLACGAARNAHRS
jgi:hypothetical protein